MMFLGEMVAIRQGQCVSLKQTSSSSEKERFQASLLGVEKFSLSFSTERIINLQALNVYFHSGPLSPSS